MNFQFLLRYQKLYLDCEEEIKIHYEKLNCMQLEL